MIEVFENIEVATKSFDLNALNKNSWLVILYAKRFPPHIGLLLNGNYNSLTIKGHELNISVDVLIKTITKKNIETIFVKITQHPVFSINHQLEMFQEMVKKYKQVKQFEATCLNPIKLFFQEFYALNFINEELLFAFFVRLNENLYLDFACSLNFKLKENIIELPFYTLDQLNDNIKKQRLPYYTN